MNQASSPIQLLLVDDEAPVLRSMKRLIRSNDYQVHTAMSGKDALQLLEETKIDMIISDMRMPQMSGAQFLEKAAKRWPDTIRMVLTGYADLTDAISAINSGQIYRYFSKPWDEDDVRLTLRRAAEQLQLKRENDRLQELIVKQNRELKSLNADLETRVNARTADLQATANKLDDAYSELQLHYEHTVELLARFSEMRDVASAGHGRRVAELAKVIASGMGLDAQYVKNIRSAGLLHDVGKMALPDDVVNSPYDSLNSKEQTRLAKHVKLGEAALMGLKPLKEASQIIRSHHEHFDGSGYPDGLKAGAIPLGARILAVAEAIDEYCIGVKTGQPTTVSGALVSINKYSGILYDPQVVNACTAMEDTLASMQQENGPSVLRLSTRNAKPGMVLLRDLISSDGMLLLTAGHELSASILNKIRQMERDDNTSYLLHVRIKSTDVH